MEAPKRTALRGNQSQAVSNLDYYPTVLSAMGVELEAADRQSLELGGNDLTQPLPAERDIPCLNTGALRSWSAEPVALARGRELLIYHEPAQRFELLDPGRSSTTDLWPGTSLGQKEIWMTRLAQAGLWPKPRHTAGKSAPEKRAANLRLVAEMKRFGGTFISADFFKNRGGLGQDKVVAFDLAKATGTIVYGPYRWYPPGKYEAFFDMALSGIADNGRGRLVIEVADDSNRFLAQRNLPVGEPLSRSSGPLTFSISGGELFLEFRIFADGFTAGMLHFSGVHLKRLG